MMKLTGRARRSLIWGLVAAVAVIQALTCQFRVSKESIAIAYLIDFDRYFAGEIADLRQLARDGLVKLNGEWIAVTPRGRMLVRNICMVFDRYLRREQETQRFDSTITFTYSLILRSIRIGRREWRTDTNAKKPL